MPEHHTLGTLDFLEVNAGSEGSTPRQLLVFVHGTPGSASAFMTYLTDHDMQQNFHMISVTRPGWVNEEDVKIPELEAQAGALKPLLERNRSSKGAILMGHSYGGPVIARAAMDFSELVEGLVFVATTGDPELSGPRWYNRFAVVIPRFMLGHDLKGANAEIMHLRPQLEAMLPRWRSLQTPAIIIQGDRDRLVNPDNAFFLEQQLEGNVVEFIWLENEGHFILWERSDLIRDAILTHF